MSAGTVEASPAMAAPPLRVGTATAYGALWTLLISVLSKGVTLASQIALAWFLLPEQFGLAAMALSFTSVTGIVGGNYLKNVLIQRSDRFEEEAGQVFWLALAMNLLAAVIMCSLSPIAGHIFKEPRVLPLILVVALTAPVHALPIIYSATLHRNLRFRQAALINFGSVLVQNGGAVFMAWTGWGAYSLVVPAVAMAIWTAAASRLASGRIHLGRPEPRRWLPLQASVGWLMFNSLFVALQNYGASFVIGFIHNDPVVAGFYYWGLTISSQVIFLLATNLQGVLFPALSKLNADPARQYEAVRRACQTLTVAVVPVCVLQMLLAGPLIGLVFHDRWLPSVPVVQWLSLGLLTQPVNILASSTLLARGAFSHLAGCTALTALSMVAAAAIGASIGQQAEIARCVGIGLMLSNLATGWVAYRQFNHGWKDLLSTISLPVSFGIMAGAIGGCIAFTLQPAAALVVIGTVLVATLGVYSLLVRQFLGHIARDLLVRLRPMPKSVPV